MRIRVRRMIGTFQYLTAVAATHALVARAESATDVIESRTASPTVDAFRTAKIDG